MVKMSCEMIGMTQLASEWGLAMKRNTFADSSAVLEIAKRRRSRKMRHVKIGTLWIQEKNETGERQVQGSSNPADLMTKKVHRRTLDKMAAPLQQHFKEGHYTCRPPAAETSLGGGGVQRNPPPDVVSS